MMKNDGKNSACILIVTSRRSSIRIEKYYSPEHLQKMNRNIGQQGISDSGTSFR
jgi:hypothetical protein